MQAFMAGFLGTGAVISWSIIIISGLRRKKFERKFREIELELEEYHKKGQTLNAKAALGRMRELFKAYAGYYPGSE